MKNLTAQQLRALVIYYPETGVFKRRVTTSPRAKAGDVVGKSGNLRYLEFRVRAQTYKAHRLAWLYVHGRWPTGEIDHINGNTHDNRLKNLRDVSHVVNRQNMRKAMKHSRTGWLGVSKDPKDNRKYRARLFVRGREVWVGLFGCPRRAHEAYVKAKRALHEGCTL